MKKAVIYIHGKGGRASESKHYKPLFPDRKVIGLDYKSFSPLETGKEIHAAVENLKKEYGSVILIANSIGAFFSMNVGIDRMIEKAYFISPIVDMEKLISDMMIWADITEDELKSRKVIPTSFGEDLSWDYLCYVRNHPINWDCPTEILYGANDNLTSFETIKAFADKHNAELTIMENGEHWFHTEEQMKFLDDWISQKEIEEMKTVIIHGQSHKGSTCHIAQMLAEKIGGDTTEFFLPRDFGEFCCGCTRCFVESETKCPHYDKLSAITQTIDEADVIILASPVYVYHATGAMKAFLDHYGYRWMVHRPEETMFKKQGVCISTAAGGGMKSTNKDMAYSLFHWGVAKIYKFGIGVAAIDWNRVSEKKKRRINRATDSIAKRIRQYQSGVKPGLKTKGFFWLMHVLQKNGWNEADVRYWKEKGWTGKARPWKKSRKRRRKWR